MWVDKLAEKSIEITLQKITVGKSLWDNLSEEIFAGTACGAG